MGIRDFWVRKIPKKSPSKIPKISPIPGMGIWDFRGRKIPKKSPRKIPKISPIPGMGIWDFWGRKIPKKSPIKNPQKSLIPGMGIFKSRGYPRSPIPKGGALELTQLRTAKICLSKPNLTLTEKMNVKMNNEENWKKKILDKIIDHFSAIFDLGWPRRSLTPDS